MHEQEHDYDIFEVGEEVPWGDGYATIVEREVVETFPDDVDDWQKPGEFTPVMQDDDADFVLLTLAYEYETFAVPATWLVQELKADDNPFGKPRVRASLREALGHGTDTKITVNCPATGSRQLTEAQARSLADFLDAHADYEPLRVFLGDFDSAEEVEALADSLRRAADVRAFSDRLE